MALYMVNCANFFLKGTMLLWNSNFNVSKKFKILSLRPKIEGTLIDLMVIISIIKNFFSGATLRFLRSRGEF